MAILTPNNTFDDVPQLDLTTVAAAGPGGPMNAQAQALTNRTKWLKGEVEKMVTFAPSKSVFEFGGVQIAGVGNHSTGSLLCDWQASSGTLSLISANGGGEAAARDEAVTCDGLPMACATLGNTGTYIADYVFSSPAYLAQMQSLQIPMRVSSNNVAFTGANPIQIWLLDDSTGTRQWRLASSLDMSRCRPNITTTLSFGPGVAADGWSFGGSSAPTNTSDMDAYTIYKVRIVMAVPAGVAGGKCWFGPIRANSRRKPVVSIVLDGQYSSQHNYLLPMIEAQGLRCSLALQHSLIGTAGRMSESQLGRAYLAGHEFIHHTYDGSKSAGYQSASDWADAAAITADINLGQDYQRLRDWTRGIGYMVHGGNTHPFAGSVSPARQSVVAAGIQGAGIKAARSGDGIGTGPLNRLQNVSRLQNIDPLSLHGALQLTNTDSSASMIAATTRAKARGEWAIYTGHRSVVSGAASLEVLNGDAFVWLQSLGDDARSGKVLVLPFGEACAYYGISA